MSERGRRLKKKRPARKSGPSTTRTNTGKPHGNAPPVVSDDGEDDSDRAFLDREAHDRQRDKHPDDPETEYVPEGFDAEDFLNHYPLDYYRTRAASGDPTAIIEAFVRAHDDHCYPRWLLDRIAVAFDAYRSNKKVTLDDALRLSPAKWTQHAIEARQWDAASDLHRLTVGLGVSLNKASEMVARKLEEDPAARSGRVRSFDFRAETLRRKYTREWKARFALTPTDALPPRYRGGRDPDRSADEIKKDWAQFLRTFPRDTLATDLPADIRRRYLTS